MKKIEHLFDRLRAQGEKALIPFVMAGDPNVSTTRDLVLLLEDCGAHFIELGVPFSDPLADGPVIQAASLRSLRQGVTFSTIFRLVENIRQKTDIPIVIMTYYNPVYQFGLEKLACQAAEVGVDGFIIPDLPPEEADGWREAARRNELDTIFLVAPNTPLSRAKRIASETGGFLYAVSITGITGTRKDLPEGLIQYLRGLRLITNKPLAVGFGISTPAHVQAVSPFMDGVIIGSALVDYVARYSRREGLFPKVRLFVNSLVGALQTG
jgi:tryptophan synthase alpha chain